RSEKEMKMPKPVTLFWNCPPEIECGTRLGHSHLCAKAKDESGGPAAGTYVYDPPEGTILTAGTHELKATFTPNGPDTYEGTTATVCVTVKEAAGSKVNIKGKLIFGGCPIEGACVKLTDLDCCESQPAKTNTEGYYAFDAPNGHNEMIELPACVTFQSETVYLKGPQQVYLRPCAPVCLPDTFYESRGCRIAGSVKRHLADTNCDEPLAGVQVTLSNCERNVISTVASDACGEFCINT